MSMVNPENTKLFGETRAELRRLAKSAHAIIWNWDDNKTV